MLAAQSMHVMNHNWSAMKQRLHLQSVAEISHHSVLLGDRFDNVGHHLGLTTRTQAGKVTIGLASQWPCVTDNSGLSTYSGDTGSTVY